MTSRSLRTLEIIDWYDGIVQAIVLTNWMPGTYLCSLLAYDVELRKRVFALLQISDKELSEIRFYLVQGWDSLFLYLKQLWDKADGSVVLICCDNFDKVISLSTAEAYAVKEFAISSNFADVADESRNIWFDLFKL